MRGCTGLPVLSAPWRRLAQKKPNEIDRGAYTLGVLEQVRSALKRRDVFVRGSKHWGDPQRQLLQGTAWEKARQKVCRTLGLEFSPNEELKNLVVGDFSCLSWAMRKSIQDGQQHRETLCGLALMSLLACRIYVN